MKITCHFAGPTVGSSVTEVVDIVEDWGMSADAPDAEIEEAVMDWASSIYSVGWSRYRSDEDVE